MNATSLIDHLYFLERRPERWSIRRHKSSTTINNKDNEHQQQFMRRWSLRLPATDKQSNMINSKQTNLTATNKQIINSKSDDVTSNSSSSSSSSSWNMSLAPLKIPDYFRVNGTGSEVHDKPADKTEEKAKLPSIRYENLKSMPIMKYFSLIKPI